jgi:7-carboxy-7-deazaguanine synthase
MRINEIFLSIQGEGLTTGLPTIFIRTTGCNLRCAWCDSIYSYYEGKEMTIDEIVKKVKKYPYKNVAITGGEPLIQKDMPILTERLLKEGYSIVFFTNGSIDVNKTLGRIINNPEWRKNVTFCMDFKAPSSKMEKFNRFENIKYLNKNDVVKFVISDIKDWKFALSKVKKYKKDIEKTNLFFCQEGGVEGKKLAEWIIENKLNARIQVQLHKIIYPSITRGV